MADEWLLVEDEALKTMLKGMTVTIKNGPTVPVGVWFKQPDIEARDQSYPYVVVDMVDLREATERAHRGQVELTYTPVGAPPTPAGMGHVTDFPIPYTITYQVTTYARDPRHDRQLIKQMIDRVGGRIHTLYVPEDDTQRSMYLVGFQKRDQTDQDHKRLHSNAFTITVFTELLPREIEFIHKVLDITQTVNLTLDTLSDIYP